MPAELLHNAQHVFGQQPSQWREPVFVPLSQVMDHQTTIQLFQNEKNNGSDADVKNYTSQFLPKIQMHYQMADIMSARF